MDLFNFVTITPDLLDKFLPLIPPSLEEKLRTEQVLGIGSVVDHIPRGAMIFQLEEDAAILLTLYIDEEYRRRGMGQALIEKLRTILRQVSGIYSIRVVLENHQVEEEAFFTALGAHMESTRGKVHFPVSYLAECPLMHTRQISRCIAGADLEAGKLNDYMRKLEKSKHYLLEGRITDNQVRQDLSMYYTNQTEILGCAIVTENETGFCLAMLNSQAGGDVAALLLSALCQKMVKTLPPNTKISLETVIPSTERLLEGLLPMAEKTSCKVAVLELS